MPELRKELFVPVRTLRPTEPGWKQAVEPAPGQVEDHADETGWKSVDAAAGPMGISISPGPPFEFSWTMDRATYDDLRYLQVLMSEDGHPAKMSEVITRLLEEVVKHLERRERRRERSRAARAKRR